MMIEFIKEDLEWSRVEEYCENQQYYIILCIIKFESRFDKDKIQFRNFVYNKVVDN